MSAEIRQLIESYYDIQKIRVETFNRIVCWVKENRERLLEALSHSTFGSHNGNVSQIKRDVAQRSVASPDVEAHRDYALKLLESKKYSLFVKKYVLSYEEGKGPVLIALKGLIKEIGDLVWFHNKLYETEKELYARIDGWSKDHPLRRKFLNGVKGIGPILASGIISWLATERMYTISGVVKVKGREVTVKRRGVKEKIVLPEYVEIVKAGESEIIVKAPPVMEVADRVSKLWSYVGLAPGQERKKGKRVNYNPKLKTFCWKIGQSFIKFRCKGRILYEEFKKEAEQKHPDWSKLHIHNHARRKMVKLFLAAVWEKWRKMNNLPVTEPYPIQVLGHTKKITPEWWIERGVEP